MLNNLRVLLAAVEGGGYGVDANPTGALNAILCKSFGCKTFQGNKVTYNYVRPFFGNFKAIHTGPHTIIEAECYLSGSGTAGTAPAYGPLLRACSFQEKLNAAAVNATAQAGSTTTTLKLSAGDAGADNAYAGFVVKITAGTGNGQSRVIRGNVSATKVATVTRAWSVVPDATSQYSILAQAVYLPISSGQESASFYYFMDGELHKSLGMRGSVVFGLSKEDLPTMKFTFTGLRTPAAAQANPSVDYSKFQEPLPANLVNTPVYTLHGYAGRLESFSIDVGNKVAYRNLPGSEQIVITDRQASGPITFEKPTLAQKDFEALVASDVTDEFLITHGTAAGNIVDLRALVQLSEPSYGDSDSIITLQLAQSAVPTDNGNDEIHLCVR